MDQTTSSRGFCEVKQMRLCCDDQIVLHITSNLVFHERIKHMKIHYHFVREKLLSKEINIDFVSSNDQFEIILTISLRGPRIQFIYSKLETYNLYASA